MFWIRGWSIRRLLLAVFAVGGLYVFGMVVFLFARFLPMASEVQVTTAATLEELDRIDRSSRQLLSIAEEVRRLQAAEDYRAATVLLDGIEGRIDRVARLQRLSPEEGGLPDEVRRHLTLASGSEAELVGALGLARAELLTGRIPEARRTLERIDALSHEFQDHVQSAQREGLLHLSERQTRIQEMGENITTGLAWWLLLGLILVPALIWVIDLRLNRPLKALRGGLRDLFHGDYGVRIDISSDDELAQLGRHFNELSGLLMVQREHSRSVEGRLTRLWQDSTSEIYIFDARTFRLTQVNGRARQNLGYTEGELHRLTLFDLDQQTPGRELQEVLDRLRDGDERHHLLSTTFERYDGTTYPVELNLHFSGAESPPVFLAVALDVTERRKLREQLEHSQRLESLGRLAGGVAHDFNNLLTVIMGYLDLLRQELSEQEYERLGIGEASDAAARAAELTMQLLGFARKQIANPVEVDPMELLAEVEAMLRRLLGERVELVVETAGDIWPIQADRGQFQQVLVNLAVNARDAMGSRDGTLRLTLRNHRLEETFAIGDPEVEPGPYVELSVSDDGSGMTEATVEKIFEPFFTTKAPGEGSGLGLSLVHGIMKQMGGHVTVESEIGNGTTFRLYFPKAGTGVPAARAGTPGVGVSGSRAPRP